MRFYQSQCYSTAIAHGGTDGECQEADREARKNVKKALKSIFNELKETQKTCQERFQSILPSVGSNVDEEEEEEEDDDDTDTPATPSDDDSASATLRTLYHSLADEYSELIKFMRGATTAHDDKCKEELDKCKEKLDKLDEGVKQAGAMLDDLERSGPANAKEKHLATLKVLQVLVQNMNTASEVLTLIDRAQESQQQPREKQKSLIERTQAFEKSLSELKQSKRDDDDVRELRAEVKKLRDENTRYKADLEEAKKIKEVSESLNKLLEKQSGGNSDIMSTVAELRVRITQLKEERDGAMELLEQERHKITQLQEERDSAVESLEQERQKITQLEKERDSTVKSLEQERQKITQLEKERDGAVESLEQEHQKVTQLEQERSDAVKSLEQERKKLKKLKKADSLLKSATETLRQIIKLKEGVSSQPVLSALQSQAFDVASEFKKQKEELESLIKSEAPSKLEIEEMKTRVKELNKEIERVSSENANLQQKIRALMIRLHEWNGTVSTGPFAYPHTMLFLPRPDCDGVYEAYNQGYPCYFLSDESTDFREQIRDNEPVIGTLLLDPEPHIAEPGNRFKLAPGTRYWLCTCAAFNS